MAAGKKAAAALKFASQHPIAIDNDYDFILVLTLTMPPADISPVSQAASAPPAAPQAARAAEPPAAPAAEPPALAPAVQAPEKLRIDPEAMRRQLQDVADMLNRQVAKYDNNLGFSVDEVANMHVVTVVNKESGEVVRRIPSEAALRIAHSIESLKGILYNRTI